MKRAFVTDVHYRMGLAAVRSLGKRSIPVTSVEFENIPQKSILGFYSRFSSESRLVPNAAFHRSEFINSLIEASKKELEKTGQKPVLIPVGLDTLMAVSSSKEQLEPWIDFIVPPLESIETANDTNSLLKIASDIGIPCPETTTLGQDETIKELSDRLKYPVVIKYRKGEVLKLTAGERYRIVKDPETFIKEFSRMHEIQSFPIVQRYISGAGYGVSAVFDNNGEPIEIFCHKRLREYPVTGGPSCFCESVWNDRLVDYAIRLLKNLNWRGLAMVEFKGDPEGDVSLMEINPRFWGSLPLSIEAGCDIPYALYRAANGETVPYNSTLKYSWYPERYKKGKRMRYLFQDMMSMPGYLKRSRNKTAFVFRFIGQLFNPAISDGVLKISDCKPSFKYIVQAFKKI